MNGSVSVNHKLRALFDGIEALYQTRSGLDPTDVIQRVAGGPRETLLLREDEDALRIALVFGDETLRLLEGRSLDESLSDAGLGESLPVLEGLSHLVYVAEAARCERPVSGLELETQAEVDKLALVLLHRWPASTSTFEQLVERLYIRFELLPGPAELQQRYLAANRIALRFAQALRESVRTQRIAELRATLRGFWSRDMEGKRALAA
ncbi:MAG: hypothetical protein KUG77_19115 [Nannocystaceae bacterium]|nr:hypothetical protein [Nannocystaceae bacterium]